MPLCRVEFSPLLLVLFSLAFSPSAIAGRGNGSDRGGGDEFVAEFQDVRRTVVATLKAAIADGNLENTDELGKFLSHVADVRVYSFASWEEAANSANPGFRVLPETSPPQILFSRQAWIELKDQGVLRVEEAVFKRLLEGLQIPVDHLPAAYREIAQDRVAWKFEKYSVIAPSLDLYRTASRYLESDPYQAYRLRLVAWFKHSSFEKCLGLAGHQELSIRQRKKNCQAWMDGFLADEESYRLDKLLPRMTRARSSLHTPFVPAWASPSVSSYAESLRAAVSASFLPLTQFAEALDSCFTAGDEIAQVRCMALARESVHEEKGLALRRSMENVDEAFELLSETLAVRQL